MTPDIQPFDQLDVIVALLSECGLPTADIAATQPPQFFAITENSRLAAVIGFERFGTVGLLRSLAVAPACRGRGLAQGLVAHVERLAKARGVATLYLLTTSADGFFTRLGYAALERSEAPPAIRATAQFAGLCPASSTFMGKPLV